jgi:hypothetical protein
MHVWWRCILLLVLCGVTGCSGCSDADPPTPNRDGTTLTIHPIRLLADGRTTATITVTVRDDGGTPVADQQVALAASGNDHRFSAENGTTDEQGVFVSMLSSTSGGAKIVTATIGTIAVEREIQFTAVAPCNGLLVLGSVPSLDLPNTRVVGDLDGDGTPDIVGVYLGSLQVRLGNGNGTYRDAGAVPINASAIFDVDIADLNADNRADVIVATPNGVRILFGNPDATFQAPVELPRTLRSTTIATGDFDNDGKLDIAAESTVFYGRGDGTFDPAVAMPIGDAFGTQLAAGDFDGDGTDDLVAALNSQAGAMRVVTSNIDRTFDTPADVATGGNPLDVVSADFNADGKLDVAALEVNSTVTMTNARIMLGQGNGTFVAGSSVALAAMDSERRISVVDVDADGRSDIVGAGSIVRGNGDGTFAAAVQLTRYPGIASAVDVDGDGDRDVVFGTGVIALADGPGVFAPNPVGNPGELVDLDNDGFIDVLSAGDGGGPSVQRGRGDGTFEDRIALPTYGQPADFNRDGILDFVAWRMGIIVALGRGDFDFESLPAGVRVFPQLVRDFDGDGRTDVIGGLMGMEDAIHMLPGNGDGTFGSARVSPGSFLPNAVEDFDRDGTLDLVATGPVVRVIYGNGDGTFANPIDLDSTLPLGAIATGDVTEDGWPDIVAASALGAFPSKLRVFPGNATGHFGAAEDVAMPVGMSTLVEDVNGDGRLDIVSTGDGIMAIRLRNAQGGFDPTRLYPVSGRLFDVNLDGRLDVIAGSTVALQKCLP